MGSIIFKLLQAVEKASASFSDHVIISNHLWEKKLISRSVRPEKCTVFMNYPDPAIFYRRPRTRKDGKFVLIYPGTLNWHQGVDIAIKSFHLIQKQVPEAEFHIYGNGQSRNLLSWMVQQLGLENRVFIRDPLPIDKIAEVMANADMGIVPKRNDPFGGEAFSTKIFEFMNLGIPVLASRTKIDQYYFNDSVVRFFEPENSEDLADAMVELIRNREMRERLVENGFRFICDFDWDKKKNEYFELIDSLIDPSRKKTGRHPDVPYAS